MPEEEETLIRVCEVPENIYVLWVENGSKHFKHLTYYWTSIYHWRQPTKDNKRCLHSRQIQTTAFDCDYFNDFTIIESISWNVISSCINGNEFNFVFYYALCILISKTIMWLNSYTKELLLSIPTESFIRTKWLKN